jgi:hypothetical protein
VKRAEALPCHDGEPRACASRAAAAGQADAKAILTRRALIFTNAPIPAFAGTSLQQLQPDRAAGGDGELGMSKTDPTQRAKQAY